MPGQTILRLPDVKKRTGLSKSTIYERVSDGRFPRPIALGERSVGWIESEIDAWIAKRVELSRPRHGKVVRPTDPRERRAIRRIFRCGGIRAAA